MVAKQVYYDQKWKSFDSSSYQLKKRFTYKEEWVKIEFSVINLNNLNLTQKAVFNETNLSRKE